MKVSMEQMITDLEDRMDGKMANQKSELEGKIKDEECERKAEIKEVKDNYIKRFDRIEKKLDTITGWLIGLLITVASAIILAYGLPAFFTWLKTL